MARHGENIRKRADGRWEGRYPAYSEKRGQKIYRSVYGRTYIEVKDKLAAEKNSLKAMVECEEEAVQIQRMLRVESVTVTDAAKEWLMEIKDKRKQSTFIKYQFIYDQYIEKNFRTTRLHIVTDSFVKERLPESLSDSTRKSVYCVLNQVLKFASVKYSIPISNLNASSCGRNRPIEVLNRKEQSELFSVLYCEMDIFKAAILLCLYTGLRLGEVCALKWTDIDLENRLILVNRTVQRLYVEGYRTKTILLETAPKSEFSRREIPLSDTVVGLLTPFRYDKEYVFGGHKPMEPRTLQNRFKKIIKLWIIRRLSVRSRAGYGMTASAARLSSCSVSAVTCKKERFL